MSLSINYVIIWRNSNFVTQFKFRHTILISQHKMYQFLRKPDVVQIMWRNSNYVTLLKLCDVIFKRTVCIIYQLRKYNIYCIFETRQTQKISHAKLWNPSSSPCMPKAAKRLELDILIPTLIWRSVCFPDSDEKFLSDLSYLPSRNEVGGF